MLHPKIAMFLETRDDAYARRDVGIVRSMNAELRRYGVPDDATIANPTGKAVRNGRARETAPPAKKPRNGLPKCEHENVAERCTECNPELAAH